MCAVRVLVPKKCRYVYLLGCMETPFEFDKRAIREHEMSGSTQIKVVNITLQSFA